MFDSAGQSVARVDMRARGRSRNSEGEGSRQSSAPEHASMSLSSASEQHLLPRVSDKGIGKGKIVSKDSHRGTISAGQPSDFDVCPRCSVYRAFAGMTDECCEKKYKWPCMFGSVGQPVARVDKRSRSRSRHSEGRGMRTK